MTKTLNQQTVASTASRYTSVTTIHNQVGYSNNVEIIETALRERFGLNDNSYVLKAVAAHIWSSVCGTERATWNQDDVSKAISSCMYRLNNMKASLALKPVATSPVHEAATALVDAIERDGNITLTPVTREADLSDAIAITKQAAADADARVAGGIHAVVTPMVCSNAMTQEPAIIKIPATAIAASESLRADVLAHRTSIINVEDLS
jgi:hypothetical protein